MIGGKQKVCPQVWRMSEHRVVDAVDTQPVSPWTLTLHVYRCDIQQPASASLPEGFVWCPGSALPIHIAGQMCWSISVFPSAAFFKRPMGAGVHVPSLSCSSCRITLRLTFCPGAPSCAVGLSSSCPHLLDDASPIGLLFFHLGSPLLHSHKLLALEFVPQSLFLREPKLSHTGSKQML